MRAKTTGGITSYMLPIFVQDSTSTTGAGLGSLVYNSAGLVAEYRRYNSSSWTAITLVSGATLGSFTSGGWVADGSLTGAYEVGIPNAAMGANVPWVVIRFRGATNMVPCQYYIELDAVAYSDGTRFGLAALPNANASAFGGLLTVGTSTGQINPASGAVPTSDGLKPTTAGRTLDVTATGEAGIDWANIGSPTTTVNFSGTTVSVASTVTNGVTVTTNNDKTGYSLSTTPPTAATIADAVWDEARSGHVTAGSFGQYVLARDDSGAVLAPASTALSTATWTGTRAGYLDNLSGGAVALASGVSIASGGITTGSFASGAINAAAIAADAIGASELAADAVTEIVSGVLTTAMTEAYNTDGAAPTLAQALFLLISATTEFSISGTTITCKKLDGSTSAATYALDSATTPTSRTRAS